MARQWYALNLTVQQRYALHQLRAFYTLAEDDDMKSKINAWEAGNSPRIIFCNYR